MKRKIKIAVDTILVLFLLLSFSIPTDAANNLKTLQDKYRNSYNNLTNAIKENADQERIDQLSAQCKADYEEYQKVLNPTKEEVKPKTIAIKPTSITKATSNTMPADKTIQLPVTYKQIKININGSIRTIRAPYFDYKPLKPVKIASSVSAKPLRISAPIRISQKAEFSYTQLPEISNSTNDTTKAEGIKLLNDLKTAISGSSNENVTNLTYTICFKYSNYPDLCAASRLCFAEYNLKKYPLDTSFQNVPDWQANEERIKLQEMNHELKKIFEELNEAYSKNNNPVCISVITAVNSRLETINKNMSENNKEMNIYAEKLKKSIVGWETFMKSYVSKDYPDLNSVPTKEQYQGAYNNAFGYYTELRWIYKALRDNEKYSELNKDFELKYMDMPTSVTFKYFSNGPNSAISYCTISDIKKNFMNYSYFKKDYIDANSVFCESTLVNYDDLDKQINDIRNYVDATHNDEENKTNNLVRKVTEQLNKSQTFPLISEYYFTGNEDFRNINQVFNVNEIITLRASISPPRDKYLYPVKDTRINSVISKRSKQIVLTKCVFNYGYYAKFQANETDDSTNSSVNIINNDKEEFNKSVALFHGNPPAQYIAPATALINLYDNPYFKNRFGHSDVNSITECNQTNHGVFKDTYSFIKSGGAEKVYEPNLKNFVLIRHQANWFVIYGHGNPKTGSIGEHWTRKDAIIVRPTMTTFYSDPITNQATMVEGLIKRDGTSEYNENMHVLVLAACDCLQFENQSDIPNITNWYNVLPTGTILGYRNTVLAHEVIWVIEKMNEYLKNNPTNSPDDIISAWMRFNLLIANGSYICFGQELRGATAIKGTTRTCYYGEFGASSVTVSCRYKIYFYGTKSFNF